MTASDWWRDISISPKRAPTLPPGLTQHLHLRWCEEIFQRMYSRTWERAAFLRLHSSPNQGVGKLWAKLDAVPKLSPLFCQVLQFPRKVTRDGCSRRVMDFLHPNQLSSKWFPLIFVMTKSPLWQTTYLHTKKWQEDLVKLDPWHELIWR